MAITLSATSQDLISQVCKKNSSFTSIFQYLTTIERETLLHWFDKTNKVTGDEETVFLMAALHASLLKDLYNSLGPPKPKTKSKSAGWSGKAKFALLAVAGTIYFSCEGFDGITAIMGIFSSIPTFAIFAAGTLFSVLSVIVFYSFDLVEISKNLGVKSGDAPKLLDVLLDEFKQIKAIRLALAKAGNKTQQELESDLAMAKMLHMRHIALDEAREKLKKALDNPYLNVAKMVTAGIAGIIFFSGGFFAGQTVAIAIASLFLTSVAATFWPIVLASVVVGLAAFSVYWFVERPGIENLISRWKGLDKDKIDALCKSKVVDRETAKLQNLIDTLSEKISLQGNNIQLEAQNKELSEKTTHLEKQNSELSATVTDVKKQNSELLAEVARLKLQLEDRKAASDEPTKSIVSEPIVVNLYQSGLKNTLFGGDKVPQSAGNFDCISLKEPTLEIIHQ